MSYGQSYKIIVMLLANGIKVFSEDDIDTLESEVNRWMSKNQDKRVRD